MRLLRLALLAAAAAEAAQTTTTTTTTTDGPHDGRTDGPTPSKALTAPATSAAVSAGPPRTDVAPPGRTRVRMVVSGRDRHTQFCIGELVFLDSAGRDVAARKRRRAAPRAPRKVSSPNYSATAACTTTFAAPSRRAGCRWILRCPYASSPHIASDRTAEDTPTDWTLEACDSCVHSDEEKWETLDVRTARTLAQWV